ncbi:pseudouridine synthase [Flavihumibacter sp. ZG627]|uniref:pseudouridine synthase n=1 Tax=Flavihumibacter sp. ZG627 TaxID=1463156 RepID=UPI00057D160A|nr:pseudouridine synthase [Flavihumibacter sp. ZG627]KIC90556.1 pseudouridine synthase [Flavihumibacter sp. ZG627]
MKQPKGFEKFANKKKAGTVKEQYRKERREEKNERSSAIDQRFDEKRKERSNQAETRKGHFPRNAPAPAPGRSSPKRTAIQLEKNTGADNTSYRDRDPNLQSAGTQMPLNKFIAHCGICARRDAASLVKEGGVTVNGKAVTEPGFKVTDKDEIKLNGKRITISKNLVYILLNKPKDYITTTEDPQGRKTVLDLIKTATTERVYPIGRLDRNTSGVLLFTNDGDLAQTLSHPKHEVKKIYEVTLDRPLTKHDFDTIANGITLEDGFVTPDAMGYADPKDKTVIGIEIHSGRNRIVRRIFEHMKYDVRGLDRVMYAGLTKKNVTRGKWRFLNEREVRLLKHFNKSAKK